MSNHCGWHEGIRYIYSKAPRKKDGERTSKRQRFNNGVTLVFFPGFMSSMRSLKATKLEGLVSEDINYLRFDYRETGESMSGTAPSSSASKFVDMTLSTWIQDCIKLIEHVVDKGSSLFFVGSSMGGWICVLVALHFKYRMSGIITLAAAPDFTNDILQSMTEDQRQDVIKKGYFSQESEYSPEDPYIIGGALLKDANEQHLLLWKDDYSSSLGKRTQEGVHERQREIATLTCPITLVHGIMDSDVSYEKSIALSKLFLMSKSAEALLVRDGDHRLTKWVGEGRLNSLVMLMILRVSGRDEYEAQI